VLDPQGKIDIPRTRKLVEAAQPMDVTFHRAIDMSNNLEAALEDIISIGGIQRILTSGGESSCLEGLDMLAKLVTLAQDRITIMPGGGITVKNVQKIIQGMCLKIEAYL
jgi:copper homeostasis protein